MFGFYIILIL